VIRTQKIPLSHDRATVAGNAIDFSVHQGRDRDAHGLRSSLSSRVGFLTSSEDHRQGSILTFSALRITSLGNSVSCCRLVLPGFERAER
jgi:hypothetical protein